MAPKLKRNDAGDLNMAKRRHKVLPKKRKMKLST
jgi:hypothetical protein